MSQRKHAVVVGGAGFIGSNLTDLLVEKGYRVDVIDNLVGGKREQVHKNAKLHVLDIRNYDAIAPIIAGADYVFHLAALPRVQYSIDHPVETHDINVNGTLNVLLAAKEGKVGRFIYSASSSAYGDQETLPLHEELPVRPLSPYGLQKYIGEEYTRMFAETYGLPAVSLRYFNVYGPRLDPEGPYALVIGLFLRLKKEGKPLTITGDGEQTRDFTHVRDVVAANILAAEGKGVGHGEVINVGSGVNTSINQLAEMMGGRIEYIAARKEPRHTRADNRKAKKLLGWTPNMKLKDGIAELKDLFGLSSPRNIPHGFT